VEVGSDGEVRLHPFARTRGLAPYLGNELTLYWISGYGGGVFLPFRDGTSGHESFGGGRYLLDTLKGADLGQAPDGRLIPTSTSPTIHPAPIRTGGFARSRRPRIGFPIPSAPVSGSQTDAGLPAG
jgi:hypothetical protein